MSEKQTVHPVTIKNANFPVDEEGRTYHVGTKPGMVTNRIVTVGDPHRAEILARHLDKDTAIQKHVSKRGFVTITGSFRQVPVSIIAIGMGMPNADMMIREVRAVVEGPILMVRFGSCGGIGTSTRVGQVAVSTASVMISRNYDYFHKHANSKDEPYIITLPCPADPTLTESIKTHLGQKLGVENICAGLNASADSFYSSQGRQDPNFIDDNQHLFDHIRQKYPELNTLEMENYMLFHLASCSAGSSSTKGANSMRAAACCMIFANRNDNSFIPLERISVLEEQAGWAVLAGLTSTEF